MLLCIFIGIGSGVSIIVSQCAGSGNTARMKEVVSTATTFLYCCAIPVTIIGLFLGPMVLKLMQVPADTWTYAVFNGILCFVNGLGEVRYPTFANLLMLWAVRIPVSYIIAFFINGTYVMACYPISFTCGMLAMFAHFGIKQWKDIRAKAIEQEKQTVT